LLIDEDLAEGGDILKSLSDGLGFAKKGKVADLEIRISIPTQYRVQTKKLSNTEWKLESRKVCSVFLSNF